MAQIVRRKVFDANLLAKYSNPLEDAIAGDALLLVASKNA
jgi:hypothetical protein